MCLVGRSRFNVFCSAPSLCPCELGENEKGVGGGGLFALMCFGQDPVE